MILGESTMTEFRKSVRGARTLIMPFGTVEAHGSHLPLNTDTFIIREVIKKVSEKNNVFMAPPLQYGVCTSTFDHPGTIGITSGTLRAITTDIVNSGYKQGFRNFILISGHGGSLHVAALREAGEALVSAHEDMKIAALSIYEMIGKEAEAIIETKNDSHAGEAETSLMLYLAPRLVKGRAEEEYPDLPRPIIVKDKVRRWKGAVWGNPQKASVEKGEALFKVMVSRVEDLVGRMEKTRI
ncbi:MAG: creatininase family protein [Deltaproteobacteria bacterium]|nr:creatininase family protein [Deltaproteobacteria bacterium]